MKKSYHILFFVVLAFTIFLNRMAWAIIIPWTELKTATGSAVIEPAQEKLLLYFWASWCPACRTKLRGELNQYSKVKVLAVNTESELEKVKDFLNQENKIKVDIGFDSTQTFKKFFQVVNAPEWIALEKHNAEWVIYRRGTGVMDLNSWLD